MPLALLEAQAMGVPIVASNVSGVADVIAHDVTGFLGNSPEELARDVSRLLSDDALLDRIGQEAHRRAERFNDLGGLAQRSMIAYSSPLPDRRTPAGRKS